MISSVYVFPAFVSMSIRRRLDFLCHCHVSLEQNAFGAVHGLLIQRRFIIQEK